MIITDGVHMVSTDSEAELHQFALRMGLQRRWYQNRKAAAAHPHYDLTTASALRRAIEAGAKLVHAYNILYDAWWTTRTKEDRATAIERGLIKDIFEAVAP